MWHRTFAVILEAFFILVVAVLILLFVPLAAYCAESATNQIEDYAHMASYDVHVYVFNKDNERLKISLFIDSKLMDTKELSSNSELKINSYPLSKGPHRFKITWWDEDVKRSFEMEETKEIQNETSVNLYASLHESPDKFDISVKLTNENHNDLEAFLYVDDSFEKSKEVGKDSTSELGTIKLEEGVHYLSIRWQDKDTKIGYEKAKKITVTKDDAVVFYAPQGISFEAKKSALQPEKTVYSGEKKETAPLVKLNEIEKSGSKNDTMTNDMASSKSDTASKSITKAELRTNNLPERTSNAEEANPAGTLEDSDKIYYYAILVIAAAYLMLRH